MTGVPGFVSSIYQNVSHYVKDASVATKTGAFKLIESGRGEKIDCYSPSCAAGQLCYVPTCPRGMNISFLSKAAVQDIIKGVYLGVGHKTGFLRTLH
jgi:hypothetical protein